jgi:hypothetical protein
MNLELDSKQVAEVRCGVRKALPKGWKARVHKYAGGVRTVVHQAPVDLLQNLKDHGLNLDGCGWFESRVMYPFTHQMDPGNATRMETLYDAMLDAIGHLQCPVYLAVGSKDDPFNYVVKPPKVLHPAVKAYADHAQQKGHPLAKLYEKIVAEDVKHLEAKQLVPAFKKKLLKMAHHSWA